MKKSSEHDRNVLRPLPIGLLLALAAFVALFVSPPSLADEEEEGEKKCGKLKNLEYELHGTKTIYEDARRYIRKKDGDELPKPFDDDSLAEEDHDLRKGNKCRPVAFYFIGRHTARFPDAEDIEAYNKDLAGLVEELKTRPDCAQKRQEFLSWRSKMVAKHDNLITELGAREERDIARRFRAIYPEFFDTKQANIEIGVTSKWRTAQTGAAFLREVANLSLGSECASLPTNDVDQPNYNLDQVLGASCYKKLIELYEKPYLEFHKQCEKLSGVSKIRDSRVDRVKDPEVVRPIAQRVASKLGLESAALSPKLLDSVYQMCKFENALQDRSVWCSLFEKRDVQALEYIEDVNSYFKSAYGPQANVNQSCPLVGHLLDAFHSVAREQNQTSGAGPRRAWFYFSHADPMKKLLATFKMFRDDESFSEQKLDRFVEELKVPKRRHWRTSIITPFSANLAFIMYRCQRDPSRPVKFKILATVTEQPVKLAGCKDTDCNSERFFSAYDNLRHCDLGRVCARA